MNQPAILPAADANARFDDQKAPGESSGGHKVISPLELCSTDGIGREFAPVDIPKLKVREHHARRNELALSSWHGKPGCQTSNLRGGNFGNTRDYEVRSASTDEVACAAAAGIVCAVAVIIGIALVCLLH